MNYLALLGRFCPIIIRFQTFNVVWVKQNVFFSNLSCPTTETVLFPILTFWNFETSQSGLIELTIMSILKSSWKVIENRHGKYLKTWNDNYVFLLYRNCHGNFQMSVHVKWQVTHEWEEFHFSSLGFNGN